jgi:hypothetical protein
MHHRKLATVCVATFCFGLAFSFVHLADARDRTSGGSRIAAVGKSICEVGTFTADNVITPPNGSPPGTRVAATVTLVRTCKEVAIGQFTSEIEIVPADGRLKADIRATCLGAGGQPSPCTEGQQVFAEPRAVFLQGDKSGAAVHSASALQVFKNLPRGKWKFEVLIAGDGGSLVERRAFVLQSF